MLWIIAIVLVCVGLAGLGFLSGRETFKILKENPWIMAIAIGGAIFLAICILAMNDWSWPGTDSWYQKFECGCGRVEK